MNNKVKMLAAGTVALLAGCAQMAGPGCRDREVTVNHKAAYLEARPEHVEICPGRTLKVKLVPAPPAGSAHTAPGSQNPGATWLSGRNKEPGLIALVVDEKAEGPYKYSITIDGIGTLDPRLTVAK